MSIKNIYTSSTYTVVEFLVFYIFIPFITNRYLTGWYKILPLFFIALMFLVILRRDPLFDRQIIFRFDTGYFKKSLGRMVVISILLIWFTGWIYPQLFLEYPRDDFPSYLLTFLLYPVASVLPQELIYRVYFFHRYRALIPEKYLLMLSNAVIFGLTHWIYGNWVAPIATFLVSWIFIFNYYKSKSLLNVSLEHYIYGMIMFTVGFGHFFQ